MVSVALVGERGAVPCVVLPPPAQEIKLDIRNMASIARTICLVSLAMPQNKPAKAVAKSSGESRSRLGVGFACRVVETLTCKGTDTVLEVKVTDAGLTAQVVPAGIPAQTTETTPVKPLLRVSSERL